MMDSIPDTFHTDEGDGAKTEAGRQGPDQFSSIMTPADIARRLKVTSEQVRNLIRKGRIYAINVGAGKKRPLYRITQEAFDDFLARRSKPIRPRPRTSSSMRRPPVHDYFPDLR